MGRNKFDESKIQNLTELSLLKKYVLNLPNYLKSNVNFYSLNCIESLEDKLNSRKIDYSREDIETLCYVFNGKSLYELIDIESTFNQDLDKEFLRIPKIGKIGNNRNGKIATLKIYYNRQAIPYPELVSKRN